MHGGEGMEIEHFTRNVLLINHKSPYLNTLHPKRLLFIGNCSFNNFTELFHTWHTFDCYLSIYDSSDFEIASDRAILT